MAKTPAAKLGAMVLAVVAVTSALFGGCVATLIHRQSAQEAKYETQTGGMAPSATSDGYGSFSPSDAAPRCLPAGTVCYEVYDEAAHMRYWVFRWPEGAGYSVVPRVTTDADGQITSYQPTWSLTASAHGAHARRHTMAERIIDMPTAKMATDLRFWLRECIVRCRDCMYYDEIIHACDHPCVTPLRGDCPENWIFSCFDNDFCCWGERKEVDE